MSTAVLALMLAMVGSVLNSVANSTEGAERRIQATGDARTVFDRISADLESMVWNGDTTLVVSSNSFPAQNDAFAMINQSRPLRFPSSGPHRMQAVFYAVRGSSDTPLGSTSSQTPELVRGFREVQWSETLSTSLKRIHDEITAPPSGTSTRVPVRAGVIRMAVALHVRPEDANEPTVISASGSKVSQYAVNGFSGGSLGTGAHALDLSRVHAVTIALAVVDDASRVLSIDDFAKIADSLPPSEDDELPLETWNNKDDTTAIEKAVASVSDANKLIIRQNIRFYQRTFPIMTR